MIVRMRLRSSPALLLLLAACASAPRYDQYGAGTTSASAVSIDRVLADPEPYLGKLVKIEGPIVTTCPKKGCWMRLGRPDDHVFVRFKDYGFFVPTSGVEGRTAIVEGQLAMEVQSVEQVRHYLEDAGKHEEAAKVTEPRRVLSFLATGVAIEQPAQ